MTSRGPSRYSTNSSKSFSSWVSARERVEIQSLTSKSLSSNFFNPSSPALCGQGHFISGPLMLQNVCVSISSRSLGQIPTITTTIRKSVATSTEMKNGVTSPSRPPSITRSTTHLPIEWPSLIGCSMLTTATATSTTGHQNYPKLRKPLGHLGQSQTFSMSLQLSFKL